MQKFCRLQVPCSISFLVTWTSAITGHHLTTLLLFFLMPPHFPDPSFSIRKKNIYMQCHADEDTKYHINKIKARFLFKHTPQHAIIFGSSIPPRKYMIQLQMARKSLRWC